MEHPRWPYFCFAALQTSLYLVLSICPKEVLEKKRESKKGERREARVSNLASFSTTQSYQSFTGKIHTLTGEQSQKQFKQLQNSYNNHIILEKIKVG